MDAAYRVIARTMKKPRRQNVSEEALRDLMLEAKLMYYTLGHAIAHAETLVELSPEPKQ